MGDRIEIVLHDVKDLDLEKIAEKLAEVLCGSTTNLFREYIDGRIVVYVQGRRCFELSIN